MQSVDKFQAEIKKLGVVLHAARNILITSPGAADGDSIGAQLALKRMIHHKFPECHVAIINDEPLPTRYQFLPDVNCVFTPESYLASGQSTRFQVGIIVDGGIDRAGRVKEIFQQCEERVFIDHHAISIEYPYTIRIVEPTASSTTELMFYISQSDVFKTPIEPNFAQQIYLGLIFDTGFFRHSNTTPEVMELAAQLLKTGFDFTRVGERGMLERSYSSLQLMSHTVSDAKLAANGKIIWATLSQKTLKDFQAADDDREGIIDHLFLTHGIEVAILFFELAKGGTKVSLRSQGHSDVSKFARSLTVHGGGHAKAAGANLDEPMEEVAPQILQKLENWILNATSDAQI